MICMVSLLEAKKDFPVLQTASDAHFRKAGEFYKLGKTPLTLMHVRKAGSILGEKAAAKGDWLFSYAEEMRLKDPRDSKNH